MIFLLSSQIVLLCTQTSTWMGKGSFCEVPIPEQAGMARFLARSLMAELMGLKGSPVVTLAFSASQVLCPLSLHSCSALVPPE